MIGEWEVTSLEMVIRRGMTLVASGCSQDVPREQTVAPEAASVGLRALGGGLGSAGLGRDGPLLPGPGPAVATLVGRGGGDDEEEAVG